MLFSRCTEAFNQAKAWQKANAWAAGKEHKFNLKIIKNTQWRSAGGQYNLKLVVIRPLGYRLTKKSKVLYRKPAYLICTDPELNIEKLLQSYKQKTLPRPKWYQKQEEKRYTSGDLINNLRAQIWSKAIGLNFSSFVHQEIRTRSCKKKANPNISAMFYMRN